jgi:hypothetical protein
VGSGAGTVRSITLRYIQPPSISWLEMAGAGIRAWTSELHPVSPDAGDSPGDLARISHRAAAEVGFSGAAVRFGQRWRSEHASGCRSCKRRSENPSLKRPGRPVAGAKIRQQMAFVGKRQGLGDEGRGALRSGSLARCRARSCTTTPRWRWRASWAMECDSARACSANCNRITCLTIGLAARQRQRQRQN